MPKTPAAHHNDLIAEIHYELAHHGAQSLIDVIVTLLYDKTNDPIAKAAGERLERAMYGLPSGPIATT